MESIENIKIDLDDVFIEVSKIIFTKQSRDNAEDHFKSFDGKIFLNDEHYDEPKQIGEFHFYSIPLYDPDIDVNDELRHFDHITETFEDILFTGRSMVRKKYEDPFEATQNLIYFQNIDIEKEYRGNGILKMIFENVDELNDDWNTVFLKAYPNQFDQYRDLLRELSDKDWDDIFIKSLAKVKTAYEKCGFVELENDFMIKWARI